MLPASSVGALAVLFGAIPRFLGFLLVLAAGWYLSALIAGAAAALLRRTSVSESASLARIGLRADDALAFIIKWAIRLLALVVAFDILGLPAVSDVLRQLVAWLPRLAAALIVIVIGGLLADVAGSAVRSATAGFRNPDLLAAIARVSVWVFALLVAANQIGVGEELVNTLFIGAAAAMALAGGLALGLGGQDVAARLVERWYAESNRTLGRLADTAQEAAVQASAREARREVDIDLLARRWRRMAPATGTPLQAVRRRVDLGRVPGDDVFKELTIEMPELAQEPVIVRQARVVEELEVRIAASEHAQTLREVVRAAEVSIERFRDGAHERRKGNGSYGGVERRIRI